MYVSCRFTRVSKMKSTLSSYKFYPSFVVLSLLCCVFFTSPLRAEVLGPGWHTVTAEPVSPQEAHLYYAQRALAANQVLGDRRGAKAGPLQGAMLSATTQVTMLSATTETPEITELARALQHDPKLIYEYVHNHIDYVPYFGSLKGATLTYLDGSGNDRPFAGKRLHSQLRIRYYDYSFNSGR